MGEESSCQGSATDCRLQPTNATWLRCCRRQPNRTLFCERQECGCRTADPYHPRSLPHRKLWQRCAAAWTLGDLLVLGVFGGVLGVFEGVLRVLISFPLDLEHYALNWDPWVDQTLGLVPSATFSSLCVFSPAVSDTVLIYPSTAV